MHVDCRIWLGLVLGIGLLAGQGSAQPCCQAAPCGAVDSWTQYCGAPGPSPCGPGVSGDYGEYGGYFAGGSPCEAAPAYAPMAASPPPAVWFFSAGALYLVRDDSSSYTFSYDQANEERQYLDQRNADFGGAPGFEARLTQFDPCAASGMELVYWQLFPSDETDMVYGADLGGNLSAILNYDQLNYNGVTADNFTNLAAAHRLTRSMDVYNVEANYVRSLCQPCGGATLSSLAGFRMFRFEESLRFASDPNDTMFTYEADELYYDIDTTNTLLGLQLGGYACAPVSCCWSFTAGAKAGVYANFADAYSRIGGAAGDAVINNGAFTGRAWRVSSEKTTAAMVAEISLGVVYCPSSCWRFAADYRVIGASGLALPTNQIYHDLRGINDVAILQADGSVLLHGGFLGVERVF
ncbi:MAG: BBP7 family outer membrane beta-barrel protein [Planctomycetales bacterium]|nr:BBP7 family outer membrane beta-barrel protein [Planctomycetales bacterium]